jgi:small-conductance mechanosensitive channel
MQEIIDTILDTNFFGNTGEDYIAALTIFLGLFLAFFIFQKLIIARIRRAVDRTENDVDDFFLKLVEHIKPPFYLFVALFIAIQRLKLDPFVEKMAFAIFIIIVVIQTILTVQKVIDYVVNKKIKASVKEKDAQTMVRLIGQVAKIVLWVLGGLLILANLGVNINSLIAGLGIGGIAIALAFQSVLGDIFASFSIFIDKPFKVGDFIKTKKDSGTVQKIGIKTSRIKSLAGSELVIPNKELTDARINNFKQMKERRIASTIGVTYDTDIEKVKKIPEMIETILKKDENIRPSRIHFKKFGASSLDFEIVYFIKTSNFKTYMDSRQRFNLGLMEKFKQEKIEFAYPTQTVFLNNENTDKNKAHPT